MNSLAQQYWETFCESPGENTFAPFHASTSRYVYTIARRIVRDEEDALDVVQLVYTKLLPIAHDPSAWPRIPDIEAFIRIETVRCADALRKRRARARRRVFTCEWIDELEIEDCTENASEAFARRQIQEKIELNLASLPDKYRLPILLHYFHGMSHYEIADALGRERSAVSRQIAKGLKMLQPKLRKSGVDGSVLTLLPLAASLLLQPRVVHSASTAFSSATRALLQPAAPVPGSAGVASKTGAAGISKATAFVTAALLLVVGNSLVLLSSSRVITPSSPHTTGRSVATAAKHANSRHHAARRPALSKPTGQSTSPTTSSLGAVSGRIVSAYTHAPLQGVLVELAAMPAGPSIQRKQANTDSDGFFRITRLPNGSYTVRVVSQPPWVAQTLQSSIYRGDATDLGDIELTRLGTIYGKVLRQPGDQALAGEVLELRNSLETNWPRVITSADGSFEFQELTRQRYELVMPAHPFFYREITLGSSEEQEIDVHLGSAGLKGRVLRDGQPCSATIRLAREQPEGDLEITGAFVRPDGSYSVGDLAAGRWQVTVVHAKPEFAAQKVSCELGLPQNGYVERDFTLPSGKVAGHVVDPEGHPASSVRVIALPRAALQSLERVLEKTETVSALDGSFVLDGLPPGPHAVTALAAGFGATRTLIVQVPPNGNTQPVRLALTRPGTAKLVSIALNMSTGEPLKEAWCTITGPNDIIIHTNSRNDKGQLTFDRLEPGRYRVQVSAPGFSTNNHDVDLNDRMPLVLRDVLYEAGAFKWHLASITSGPLASIACALVPEDAGSIEVPRCGKSGADGIWTVRGLLPGRYIASATIDGQPIRQSVAIRPHDLTECRQTGLP